MVAEVAVAGPIDRLRTANDIRTERRIQAMKTKTNVKAGASNAYLVITGTDLKGE
jgi:hypothetical protein